MSHSKKIIALTPTAFAALLYALSSSMYAEARQAERAFHSFSLRFNQRQYAAAQRDIERAASLSPRNAYYLAGRGLLVVRMGRHKFDPASFLEGRLSFSEEELRGLDDAARYYRQSLALNPLDDSSHHNLGWLHALLKQREQALQCFQRAISIDGSIALYRISLGLLYEQGGEAENAYREYESAIRLSPAVVDSQFFRDLGGRSPGAADRVVRGSISHLEGQAGRDRSPVLLGKLGKLYLHANSLDEAATALRAAVTDLPRLPRPWHNLGDVYARQGNEGAMVESYQKATLLDGGDALAWSKLGKIHDHRNDKHAAIRAYVRAVRGWMNTKSEHAGRASRVYRTSSVLFDDIVPNGFLSYCSPSLDITEICLRLAILYDEMGEGKLANYYKELGATQAAGP